MHSPIIVQPTTREPGNSMAEYRSCPAPPPTNPPMAPPTRPMATRAGSCFQEPAERTEPAFKPVALAAPSAAAITGTSQADPDRLSPDSSVTSQAAKAAQPP